MELERYRRIAGLTQAQLADKSGVDASIISRLERGTRRRASYDSIVRLARALNLAPEELVRADDPAAPTPPTPVAVKRPRRRGSCARGGVVNPRRKALTLALPVPAPRRAWAPPPPPWWIRWKPRGAPNS